MEGQIGHLIASDAGIDISLVFKLFVTKLAGMTVETLRANKGTGLIAGCFELASTRHRR